MENLHNLIQHRKELLIPLRNLSIVMGLVVLPMLALTFVAAFIAEGLQTGFRLTPKAIEPKLSKLNPISGVKRDFWA